MYARILHFGTLKGFKVNLRISAHSAGLAACLHVGSQAAFSGAREKAWPACNSRLLCGRLVRLRMTTIFETP